MRDHQLCFTCLAIMTLMIWPLLCEGGKGTKGDLRCYCNLPVCVATGYMCKSSSGVCFSEVHTAGSGSSPISSGLSSRSRHGCVELLHQPRRDGCQKRVRNSKVTSASNYPLLMCCREDMCNYVDNLDIKIHVNTKVNHSHAATGKQPSMLDDKEFLFGSPGVDGTTQRDVWFKAAVIAVPIAGGFILILLILLAVHMLRKDNRQQRQMFESRGGGHHHHLPHGHAGHPLHPHHHHHHLHHQQQHHPGLNVKQYGDKDGHYLLVSSDHMRPIGSLPLKKSNEANAKLNPVLSVVERTRNVYKNVNIVITRDNEFVCDKALMPPGSQQQQQQQIANYDEDKPLNNAFCNATVTWAELQSHKSSTPV